MVEDVIGTDLLDIQGEKSYHPRTEQLLATARSFLSYKASVVGLVITAIYFIFALVDWVYPAILGIPAATFNNMTTYSPFAIGTISGGINNDGIFRPGLAHGFPYLLGGTIFNFPLLLGMIASLRFDIGYSVLVVFTGAAIGSSVGVIAGYLGRWADELLMRLTDIFFSIPFLILIIAFSLAFTSFFNSSLTAMIVALIIVWWPTYARLSRSLALSTKSLNYVEAATAAGSSKTRNIFYHVFPNVLSPIFVQISLDLGSVILIFATLAFLGVAGSQISNYTFPELGQLISSGSSTFQTTFTGVHLGTPVIWWPIIIPGIFLLIFTVSINLFGDGLRDALDPRLRK